MILNDHDDFAIYGQHLVGKRIAFVVTGGIAAYTAPGVIRALRRYSCEVFPYATEEGLRFVTADTLSWAAKHEVVSRTTYKSEHLGQDSQTFDAVIVYPATYDFIGKMACGIADDVCSSLIASHISHASIMYFPTMHGNMYESPILVRNMSFLAKLSNISYVNPRLENNKANIPDTATCVCNIVRLLSESRLRTRGIKVLVTSGCTPVKIDNVRRLTNKFSGKLGIEIANELFLRGANVMLLQSYSGIRPPSYIPCVLFQDYEEYKALCLEECRPTNGYDFGIFSAAVADYKPKEVFPGKLPSGGALKNIELVPTEKVIDLVRQQSPAMRMVSFKYEEGKKLAELLDIAQKRLKNGHFRVVANDITLNTSDNQCCMLCDLDANGIAYKKQQAYGKINIARMIVDEVEKYS